MVKLTTALVCGLSDGRAPGDITRIKAVRQALDGIGELEECARGAPLRGVDVAHNALRTLEGIEALERSVEWVNVSHNRLESLEQLSSFRRLKVRWWLGRWTVYKGVCSVGREEKSGGLNCIVLKNGWASAGIVWCFSPLSGTPTSIRMFGLHACPWPGTQRRWESDQELEASFDLPDSSSCHCQR